MQNATGRWAGTRIVKRCKGGSLFGDVLRGVVLRIAAGCRIRLRNQKGSYVLKMI